MPKGVYVRRPKSEVTSEKEAHSPVTPSAEQKATWGTTPARARQIAIRERQRELAEARAKAGLELAEAFASLGEQPYIDVQWVLARMGQTAQAAAKKGDLATVRSILTDLMGHAKEIAAMSPRDRATLVSALAAAGPEAVQEAAGRLGMAVGKDPGREALKAMLGGGAAPKTATFGTMVGEQ